MVSVVCQQNGDGASTRVETKCLALFAERPVSDLPPIEIVAKEPEAEVTDADTDSDADSDADAKPSGSSPLDYLNPGIAPA